MSDSDSVDQMAAASSNNSSNSAGGGGGGGSSMGSSGSSSGSSSDEDEESLDLKKNTILEQVRPRGIRDPGLHLPAASAYACTSRLSTSSPSHARR